MKKHAVKLFFFISGWVFLLLAIIGIFLPILPTTPFLIVSAGSFTKGSPRFHKMLLENKYFGKELRRWEDNKTVKRETKKKATILIFISFSLSIYLVSDRMYLVSILLAIASILLYFIWKLKEIKTVWYIQTVFLFTQIM